MQTDVWSGDRHVEDAVIQALITTSVAVTHHTYGLYRAVPFKAVWQMEPCCLDDRH